MIDNDLDMITEKVKKSLLISSSSFKPDKKAAYIKAIENETDEKSRKILKLMLENAVLAEKQISPLCDDTGIPHLLIDVGHNVCLTGEMLDAIEEGVMEGLRLLPGRPMSVLGKDKERIDQSVGLNQDSGAVEIAPIQIRRISDCGLILHVLMFGGGPAIRAKTFRIFHKHNVQVFLEEIVSWAIDSLSLLGCTPGTLALGVGRSHYEASSLMLQALVDGDYNIQNDMEKEITARVNKSNIGPIGIKGDTTLLATFLKIGPQRASGVRIVSMRPCCCVEPRIASIRLL